MGMYLELHRGHVYSLQSRIAEHAEGTVRAVKLVYRVTETDDSESKKRTAVQGPGFGVKW